MIATRLLIPSLLATIGMALLSPLPLLADDEATELRRGTARLDPVPGGASNELTLELFDDVRMTAMKSGFLSRGPSSSTWTGTLAGLPDSSVTIVTHDGAVAGVVRTGDARAFRLSGQPGRIDVAEIDTTGFVPCTCDEIGHADAPEPPVAVGRTAAAAGSPTDDGSTIDVLVVYTPAARVAAGGQAAIEALIQLAVDETNSAASFSQVSPRLALVHTQETAYTESGNGALDVGRLRASSDGEMDEVPLLRDTHNADLVALIVETLSTCGTGYLNTALAATFGFSVVRRSCAVDNLSFAHELGHNQGCGHDRGAGLQGIFSYSYGRAISQANFRTIMATGSLPRIPRFSNPDVLVGGWPTGVNEGSPNSADHARTIDETAVAIANFRLRDPYCPADVAAPEDSVVDIADVLALLAAWGTTQPAADANRDGFVDVQDLLLVLASWGECAP